MADLDAYIASSFSLEDRIWECHDALQGAGIGVPDVWWDESREQADLKVLDLPDPEWYAQDVVVERAQRHYDAIEDCDLYVIVAPDDRTKKFNGANIELGYAYAQGCVCLCYGQLERSAMYVGPDGRPVRQCHNIDALLEWIDEKFPRFDPFSQRVAADGGQPVDGTHADGPTLNVAPPSPFTVLRRWIDR